jgi:translation elongation factor EF-G
MALSIPTLASGLKVAIVGNSQGEISDDLQLNNASLSEADAAIFIASAISGVSEETSKSWLMARELYIPSIVLVTDFATGDIDFDDMSAIASRILDPLITPYLVLHNDEGSPIALIDLETLKLFDYSSGSREIKNSDPEHRELVSEFQHEFLEKVAEFGPTGFQDALIFPAIPYISKINMGKIETLEYLAQLPTRS